MNILTSCISNIVSSIEQKEQMLHDYVARLGILANLNNNDVIAPLRAFSPDR